MTLESEWNIICGISHFTCLLSVALLLFTCVARLRAYSEGNRDALSKIQDLAKKWRQTSTTFLNFPRHRKSIPGRPEEQGVLRSDIPCTHECDTPDRKQGSSAAPLPTLPLSKCEVSK